MAKTNLLTRSRHKQALDCFRTQHFEKAQLLYQQICERDRLDEKAWAMLGIVHGCLNELEEAERCLQHALRLNPNNLDALTNLGLTFCQQGLADQAIAYYSRALNLHPDHIDTLFGMGNAYAHGDRLTQAQQCYERVLHQNPQHASARLNLANVLAYQGCAEQALSFYRPLLNANRYAAGLHSNLLLCLHYPETHDPLTVFNEHLAWAAVHEHGVNQLAGSAIDQNHDRKLRIGYVTPDLRGHSVAYFFEPLLRHHDQSRFELFCYVETGIPDDSTRKLWQLAGTVRNTCGQSDNQVAAMIRADRIDILVDLAGHTDHNRLPVFARKPAPVQITYLGYPNTTGLRSMDYRLTDEWADPPGMTEHLHTEKLVRLENGFLCFSPPVESPEVTPLPANQCGYVTYGSFNVLTKITHEMVAGWAQILLRVPGARLIVKNKQLTDPVLRERLYSQFEQHGVACERIDMLGRTSKEAHMASYGKVDIALDTFPYHGTTTTCDTLWMGIPVVTRAGGSHVSRVGVSLLTRIGLGDLVARSHEEYIDHAVSLAGDMERLSQLRGNLRETFKRSGLCDGLKFTRNIESVYAQLWQTHGHGSQ